MFKVILFHLKYRESVNGSIDVFCVVGDFINYFFILIALLSPYLLYGYVLVADHKSEVRIKNSQ